MVKKADAKSGAVKKGGRGPAPAPLAAKRVVKQQKSMLIEKRVRNFRIGEFQRRVKERGKLKEKIARLRTKRGRFLKRDFNRSMPINPLKLHNAKIN